MGAIRKFAFSLDEARKDTGVVKLIGRASRHDPDRFPRKNNLLFEEKSLSKNHAILGLKLLDPLEPGIHIIDQFRIYIKDLGSTYGIVDLNSQESDPFVVDLKNGERFGLINLDEPVNSNQRRAAKLKYKVIIKHRDPKNGIFECIVEDVSGEDSPMVSRPSTYGEDVRLYGLIPSSGEINSMVSDSSSSSSSSPYEWDVDDDDNLFEDDASADDLRSSLDSFEYENTSDENLRDEGDSDREGYTVVNLLSVSKAVDDWDIWKTNELEKRATISRGLKSSLLDESLDLLDEDDTVVVSKKESDPSKPPKSYMKYLVLSGIIGFTFGVFGSFGILAVLANKME